MIDKILNEAAIEAVTGCNCGDGGPFGAVIVDDSGNVISRGHNKVLVSHDPTNHAEVVAIREACRILGTHDLSGCTIFSSCEPCPMCLSAIVWSNIKKVYFGADRKDAANVGFRDDAIYDFLQGKNNIIETYSFENTSCKDALKNYKGDVY